jgi:DNA-binding CsgD family transcriptional regulator
VKGGNFWRRPWPWQAKSLCEESLALFRALRDKRGIAASLNGLGLIARVSNDYAEARALHEESLAILRELGNTWGIAETLSFLTRVAFEQGGYTAAKPLCEESLALYRELGSRQHSALMLWFLGYAAFVQGDYAKACTSYKEALTTFRELGQKWYIAACLDGLAGVAIAQSQPELAAHLLAAAALLREALGVSLPASHLSNYERTVATTRAQLGEERFPAAWAEGRKMTLEQVLAEQAHATIPEQTSTVPTIQQLTYTTVPPPTYPNELTPREVEVLRLVAAGLSNAQMAEKLIISPRTVHAHVRSIYSKLAITSRSAATRYAIDHKLI